MMGAILQGAVLRRAQAAVSRAKRYVRRKDFVSGIKVAILSFCIAFQDPVSTSNHPLKTQAINLQFQFP